MKRNQPNAVIHLAAYSCGSFVTIILGMILILTCGPLGATSLTWTVNMIGLSGATLKGTYVYDSDVTGTNQSVPDALNTVLTVNNLYIADPKYPSGARMNWTYSSQRAAVQYTAGVGSMVVFGGSGSIVGGTPFVLPDTLFDYPEIEIVQLPPFPLNGGSFATSAIVSESDGYLQSFTFGGTISAPTAFAIKTASLSNAISGASFNLTFTNIPGLSNQFSIWGTTNLALPSHQWLNLGNPLEIAPGLYQFTDLGPTNQPVRFYRVQTQ